MCNIQFSAILFVMFYMIYIVLYIKLYFTSLMCFILHVPVFTGLIAQVWSPLSENYAGIVKDVVDSLLLILQQDIASLMKNVLELNLHLNLHVRCYTRYRSSSF